MTLEPFHKGRVVSALLRVHLRYRFIPPLVFLVYWGGPLGVLSASQLAPSGSAGAAALGYLRDTTHLIYSALISLGALPAYAIVRKTGPVIRHTLRVVKGETDYAVWKAKYRSMQTAAFSRWLIVGCAVVALSTTVVLMARVFDNSYVAWWGHISHGYAGLYFAVMAGQMVFWGTWSFFIVAAIALVISHIARCKFTYEPLRADGCNGLRPVGMLIMTMWGYSLLAAAAIYVVFSHGYLGLEENLGIWFIGFSASLCLPLVAVLPLLSVTAAIRRARELYLLDIERLAVGRDLPRSRPDIEELNRLLEVRNYIQRSNIFPFRNQAVLIFSLVNVVQITLSARELLPK